MITICDLAFYANRHKKRNNIIRKKHFGDKGKMDVIPILLDVGNCLFFFGGFPQLVKTIKNRKTLKDLSALTFTFYTLAAALFVAVGLMLGSWMTFVFNAINTVYFIAIIYWIKKAGKAKTSSTEKAVP